MRPLLVRHLPLALLTCALAACDNPFTSDDSRLSREEVGGVYDICTLTFDPDGFPPTVDIIAAIAATEPGPNVVAPTLRVALQSNVFQLRYTIRNDVIDRTIEGTYALGRQAVSLDFAADANIAASLLPSPLRLDFSDGTLSTTQAVYTVSRDHYVSLAELTPEEARNLNAQIRGSLTARFARGGCS